MPPVIGKDSGGRVNVADSDDDEDELIAEGCEYVAEGDGENGSVVVIEFDGVVDDDDDGVDVPVALCVGVGVASGDGALVGEMLGDAPLESVEVGVPVPVGVGVPVLELVGVGDAVPVAETLVVSEAVSDAGGDVDGLAPFESVALFVELGEAVNDTVLDGVVVGELVSLVVPLPVAVALGVAAAL